MPSSGWWVTIWYGDCPYFSRGALMDAIVLATCTVRFTPSRESVKVVRES